MIYRKTESKGAILIEAILALGIAIVIITGIVSALISSLGNSSFSRNQTLASGYAQEGLEIVRSIKEVNYDAFSSYNGAYCLDASFQITSSPCPEKVTMSGSSFSRYIVISTSDPKCASSIYVSSKVTWNDSKCKTSDECHKVELNSCFINLEYIPIP